VPRDRLRLRRPSCGRNYEFIDDDDDSGVLPTAVMIQSRFSIVPTYINIHYARRAYPRRDPLLTTTSVTSAFFLYFSY